MFNNSIKEHLCARFYVTPKTGHNFDGVLIQSDRGYYVFADINVYPTGAESQKAQGELWIEKSNVAYLQRLLDVNG